MSSFVAAVRLLTVLPTGPWGQNPDARAVANSAAYFPLVGAVVGLASGGVFLGASELFPIAVAAALALAVSVAITGALHIDGLGDTFDGLLGGRTREQKLEIMADPRVGAYGVSTIVLGLIIKWSAIASLDPRAEWTLLVVTTVLARGTVAIVVARFRYVRVDGIGSAYADRAWFVVPVAALSALGMTVVFGSPASLIAGVSALVVGVAVALFARRMIDGVTGDVYGAVVELSEIVVLLILLGLIEADFEVGAIW